MTSPRLFVLAVLFLVLGAMPAQADSASDRRAIGDALAKLSDAADSLARTAKASEDRAVRRKFVPVADDLADDLDELSRRARKAAPLMTLVKTLGALDRDATDLVDVADEAEDKAERKTLRRQASQLQQAIAATRKIVEAYADAQDDAPEAPARPAAMSRQAFEALVSAVKESSFDKDKVGVVRHAAGSNYFTTSQIGALMELVSFDAGRIEVAVACWPRMVDPSNSFVLFKKLSFDSSREKLRKRVSSR